jgi:hypothetical protein
MHHPRQVRSEAAAFHAEGRSTVLVSVLMSFALVVLLSVLSTVLALVHLA